MRLLALASVLVVAVVPGCADDRVGPCQAPADGQSWPDRWQTGASLTTRRDGDQVDAWGCNAGDRPLWLLRAVGECRGSWTWEGGGQGGPPGHYGTCDDWVRLDPGEGVHQRFDLMGAPGETFRIRLQVYLQPEMLQDAGGGELRADLTL